MLWYAVLVGAVINLLLLVMLRMRPLLQFFLGRSPPSSSG